MNKQSVEPDKISSPKDKFDAALELLSEAAAELTDNAKELAMIRLQGIQNTMIAGRNDIKEAQQRADECIHKNPYVAIGIVSGGAALLGLIVGIALARPSGD